jgi:hypothetical protein
VRAQSSNWWEHDGSTHQSGAAVVAQRDEPGLTDRMLFFHIDNKIVIQFRAHRKRR